MTQSRRRDFIVVAEYAGWMMLGLAGAALVCGVVGGIWDWVSPLPGRRHDGFWVLLASAVGSAVVGWPCVRLGRRFRRKNLGRREAFLSVGAIWLVAGVVGGIPFVAGAEMGPVDAFFEAISGFTTTGATVITDIEARLSRPLLLWRSLIQWLGGMGIVVLFVAVFPNVGAGGKHLFKAEVPGTTAEGLKPRIGETSLTLWMIYAGITLVEAILLGFAGMDPFEAICHALTTMSTGGFSTRDGSVGAFGLPAVEYIIGFFMLVGSVNFGLYYAALRRGSLTVVAKNLEFRFFVLFVALSTATLAVVNYPLHADMETSFRKAFFMVGTSVSSTGYGADDYTVWPAPSLTIMLCLMFMGGSAGSTAGGMKVERVVLLAKQGVAQVKKYYRPSAVQLVRMGRKVVSSEVLGDVAAFFMLYMWTIALGVFVVSLLEGIPVDAAFGASLTCVANSGPAPFHVGDDNFAAFGATTKIFFAVLMLLGRLEFFTLLSLLVPSFWRR